MSSSNRLMYFATGDGAEAYVAPVSRLRSMHPVGSTYVDLVFECSEGIRDDADYFDYVRFR